MAQENFAVLNQHVDLERCDSGISTCWNDAPYGAYPTADGWIVIAMCSLTTLSGLVGDPAIAEWDPWGEKDRIKSRIEALTAEKPTAHWIEVFAEADVWSAPVRSSRQAMDELIAMDSDRLVAFEYADVGKVRAIACPIRLSETPADVRRPSPTIGEHTEEILAELLDRSQSASSLSRAEASG
jgi:crotonobetainyl-CoA:carnitine CoA-transferase CaiB-like acyl-CoA transferase